MEGESSNSSQSNGSGKLYDTSHSVAPEADGDDDDDGAVRPLLLSIVQALYNKTSSSNLLTNAGILLGIAGLVAQAGDIVVTHVSK